MGATHFSLMFTMRQKALSSISLLCFSYHRSELPMIGNPFGRLTRVYNAEERAVIDAFKPQYMEASSAASRKQIAHMHIFPALFNHWASIGQVIDTEEEVQLRSDVC